jgi:hypothetical protein
VSDDVVVVVVVVVVVLGDANIDVIGEGGDKDVHRLER